MYCSSGISFARLCETGVGVLELGSEDKGFWEATAKALERDGTYEATFLTTAGKILERLHVPNPVKVSDVVYSIRTVPKKTSYTILGEKRVLRGKKISRIGSDKTHRGSLAVTRHTAGGGGGLVRTRCTGGLGGGGTNKAQEGGGTNEAHGWGGWGGGGR